MTNWMNKFKSVKYVESEGTDQLKSLVQNICYHLYEEVRGWSDKIEIELNLQRNTNDSVVHLTLSIELPNASGDASAILPLRDFSDPQRVRSACRDVWGRLLDTLIAQQMEQLDRSLAEIEEV